MKTSIRLIGIMLIIIISAGSRAQVFWTEDFGTQDCSSQGTLASAYTGVYGQWAVTNTGTNNTKANMWFVSSTEAGFTAGTCGDGCLSSSGLMNKTLHVGSQSVILFCPTGDCGAAYNASSSNNITDKRVESPTINCTGHSNITLAYNYIEQGQTTLDDATLWYYDGSAWAQIANPAKSNNGSCGGQGLWTAYSIVLPSSADNNANVKIGFRWVNNGDGVGTDPSFAVDQITLNSSGGTSTPTVSFTASDTTICAGQCIDFNGSATNGPILSWAWTFTGAATTSSAVQNPTNICYNNAGNYSVTLTATNATGPGTLTKTAYITVTANPNANAGVDQTICSGLSATLTATGGGTYQWPGGSTNPITVTPANTTTYTVTVTLNGCTASDDVTVFVNPTPPANAGVDQTICSGQSATLTATGGGTYQWPGGSTNPLTVTPASTTTYTVTVTLNGCTASDDVTVFVNPTPLANAGVDQTICSGQLATLTATGGGTYQWPGGSINPLTVTPANTTTYTVTVTLNGCTASDNVTVYVNQAPLANAGVDQTICSGQSATLTATGGGTYQWVGGSTNPLIVTPANTTTYTVTVTLNGCTASDDVTVFVNPTPLANAGVDQTICSGQSATLTATGGGTYQWAGGGINPFTVTPANTTTYTVTVTLNGCTASDDVTVFVNPTPPTPVITIAGNALHSNAAAGNQWYWNNSSITGATGQDYTAIQNGTYYVIVTLNGCSSDTSNIITFTHSGIENPIGNDQISIYPNPADDNITIETFVPVNDVMISIFDMKGQMLLQKAIQQQIANIDISSISKGVYIVKLQSENMAYVTRIVKE